MMTSFYTVAALPIQIDSKSLPSLAPLIKKVSPAVVDISVLAQSDDETQKKINSEIL